MRNDTDKENLQDFLQELHAEILSRIQNAETEGNITYPEVVLTEIASDLMHEHDLTGEPQVQPKPLNVTVGRKKVRINGWSMDEEDSCLDLYVTHYVHDAEIITQLPAKSIKGDAQSCIHFVESCVNGDLLKTISKNDEVFELAWKIFQKFSDLDRIKIFVITNAQFSGIQFGHETILAKTVNLEVVDLRRLSRMSNEGRVAEAVNVDFPNLCSSALPCTVCTGENSKYTCILTSLTGNILYQLYAQYSSRLLEANIRSFLSTSRNVNKGIRETLRDTPDMFMAYNNGVVIIASECGLTRLEDGPGLVYLKDVQIVNGGQTTASIYFAKRKGYVSSLNGVHVPAKIVVTPKEMQVNEREQLISDISKYANSQNKINMSDLTTNHRFHVELEKVSSTVYLPDGSGMWFYERTAGSYKTKIALKTPAQQKAWRKSVPSSRKLTKTDVAKFMNTWDQKPYFVALGAQKNYEKFMDELREKEKIYQPDPLSSRDWKKIVSKAILFNSLNKAVRKCFLAFQANITTYTISSFARDYGDKTDLMMIWNRQKISAPLLDALLQRAEEVQKVLNASAQGRMLSEWAKKPECWSKICLSSFTPFSADIPELKKQMS